MSSEEGFEEAGGGTTLPSADGAALSGSRLVDLICSYQRSDALRAALELDLFTALAEGHDTPELLARRCSASERGMRILTDYLVHQGVLGLRDGRYRLTIESSVFLDRHSPRCMVDTLLFMSSSWVRQGFSDLTTAVRQGGTAMPGAGILDPDHPIWLDYAEALDSPMAYLAGRVAPRVDPEATVPLRVLDVAAGHGRFGLALALRNPKVRVVAVDWPQVLAVARANAAACGLAERFGTIEGNALDVAFEGPYDVVVVANFLAYLDEAAADHLMRKIHDALAPGGRMALVGFMGLDGDSLRAATTFSLIMLATSPGGQAFTMADLERRCRDVGFATVEQHPLFPTLESLVIAWK